MRTTLSLDDDVTAMLEKAVRKLQDQRSNGAKTTFKEVVNTALRQGLQHLADPTPQREPFVAKVHDCGECYFPNLDSLHDILEEVEGPWYK